MSSATMLKSAVRPRALPIELSIIACGSARLSMPELAAIRKESISDLPTVLSPQLLRHSDEQTLAALVAVSNAIRCGTQTNWSFENWAIVCLSRNLGRSAFAAVIDKYRSEGPWGVSVQVIPHCTAHAVAGTISLSLGSHGPCIAAGSGEDGEADTLISAASILRQGNWRGAWIVFSGWIPELAIDPAGHPSGDSTCLAAAIAVVPGRSRQSLGRICIDKQVDRPASFKEKRLPVSLMTFLAEAGDVHQSWCSSASNAATIRLDLARNGGLLLGEESN